MMDRSEIKKNEILEKALFLFLAEGFSRLTMEAIAARLRVSKRTLYKYFPNKVALVEAAHERQLQVILSAISEIQDDRSLGLPERMHRIFGVIGNLLGRIRRTFIEDMVRDAPQLWEKTQRFRQEEIFPLLERSLIEGMKDGWIRSDVPQNAIPSLLFTCVEAAARPEQFLRMGIEPSEGLNALIKILFEGVFNDAGRERFKLYFERDLAGGAPKEKA
jgi:AcrR family transcriptional regulator